MVGVVILTLVTVLVPPPVHLPDLFTLVISVFSCVHFLLFTLYFHYCQFAPESFPWKLTEKIQKIMSKSTNAHTGKGHKSKIMKGKKKKQQ